MPDINKESIDISIEIFFEHINDVILIFKDRKLVYCNQSAVNFFGYKKDEIQGKDYYFLSSKYQKDGRLSTKHIEELLKEIDKTNHILFEWVVKKKDGTVSVSEVSANLVKNNNERFILVYLRDISKQKINENELKKSEELFRLLTENAQDVIYKLDIVNKRFDYISPSVEALTGYPQSDFYKSIDICEKIFPEELLKFYKELRKSFREGKIESSYEYKIITKDNKVKWIHQTNSPIVDSKGKIIAVEAVLRDITDLKKVLLEKDLYFNFSLDMFAIAGMDGYFKEINPMWSKILGWSDEELLAKPWIEYVHKDDIEATLKAGKQLGEGKKVIQFDNRYLCKDGNYRWISWNSYPDIDSKKIFAVARDITDRKDMEKRITESEKKFRNIIESSPMGIHMYELLDDKLIFIGANKTANEILGVDNKIFIGKTIEEAFPPLIQTEIPSKYKEVAKNGIQWKTEQITYEDNNNIKGAYLVYAFQTSYNKMAAFFLDVTEMKILEKQIFDSEERLSYAMSATSDAMWDWSINTNETYFTGRYYTMLGYEPFEFDQSYDKWVNLIHPDDLDRVSNALLQHLDGKADNFEAEFQARTKQGEWKWILARGKIVARDEDGKPLRMVGTHTDIADRKNHEAERERLLNELSMKNKELESIIYVTSHDLRSPLVNIAGFSNEVKKSINDVENKIKELNLSNENLSLISSIFNDEIPNLFSFIDKSIEKMDALIKGLLKYSRIGIVELSKEDVDISELIDNIIKILSYEIKHSGVKIKVEKLVNCFCDKDLINQVFTNLINNSIKYLSPEKSGLIKIYSIKNEKNITYIIEDNGMGIDPAHTDKIFNLFHRLNPEDGKKGEGLGLAIVKKIIDLHKGKIWVESSINSGAKFFIQLPLSKV